jgi:hypothetical protein
LLNQNSTVTDNKNEKESTVKKTIKKKKGNAFLERIEQYKKQKLEKEKQREELRKKQKEEEIKDCTFQPKTTS